MAIYAIGDLQGYFLPLQKLLKKIGYDKDSDQLWITGDLVNRGPDSLKVLRFLMNQDKNIKTVLGNHDIHLLAVASEANPSKEKDTLQKVLAAPDLKEICHWLRHRPLIHTNKNIRSLLVHAGIYPKWKKSRAVKYAEMVEKVLQGDDYKYFLEQIYQKKQKKWKKSLPELDKLQFITSSFTQMRFCNQKGKLNFTYKGPPGSQPTNLSPWFKFPNRKCKSWQIIFGHWAALGYLNESNIISLDSGCSWGRALTAIRLDDGKNKVWQVGCPPKEI